MVQSVNRGFVQLSGRPSLQRRPDLFVSHSSHDKAFALKISEALTSVGVDVFLDSWELEVGDSLHLSLSEALSRSKFIGIVISPRFEHSTWCLDELSQALAKEKRLNGKFIIPILFDRAEPLPFLADRLYADCNSNFFRGVTQISQVVHKLPVSCVNSKLITRPPSNISEVARILAGCGWTNTSILEQWEFEKFIADIEAANVHHRFINPEFVSIPNTELGKLRNLSMMSDAVARFVELYGEVEKDAVNKKDVVKERMSRRIARIRRRKQSK